MIRRILLFLAFFFGSLLCGLLFFFIFANAIELDCLRSDDGSYACTRRTLLMGRVPTRQQQFDGVVDITMAEDCDDGCAYRAEFVTRSGATIPLNDVYTSASTVRPQVETIQAQMLAGQARIQYTVAIEAWLLGLIGCLTLMSMALSPLWLLR